MYTQRRIHSGFIGFLFILSAVVLLFFHTRVAKQELNALQQNVGQIERKLQETKKTETATEAGVSEIDRKELDRAIPAALEQDTLITDINRMTKEADISFNALTFNLQESSSLGTVSISAGFQGTQGNITRFLKMIEGNPRKLVVKNAGVSRAAETTGLPLVNLNLTLQAFYRKQK